MIKRETQYGDYSDNKRRLLSVVILSPSQREKANTGWGPKTRWRKKTHQGEKEQEGYENVAKKPGQPGI